MVSNGLIEEIITSVFYSFGELLRHIVGVFGVLEVEIVLEEFDKLDRNRSRLRQKRAALSKVVTKIFLKFRIHNHDRFSEQGSIFSAADSKDIAKICYIAQIKVCVLRHYRVPDPSPINIKI